jgi:nitrate/TMAO reductase-like tetraheme cytochrome c subunit
VAPVSRLLARFRRPVRILIQVSVLFVILAAVGTVGFVEYSAQPGFCNNCHIMIPYYESWASSSHNDVPCIKCHYAPGIKAEAMGKIQAANQVVKYVTGTYGMKPWAEIEDAACLRSGCHEQRKLEGEVVYKGVRFNHAHHLGQLRRGKQLRCTSCHSQIVQGDHLSVTESTCYLCHFKETPEGEPIAGCTGCHVDPPRVELADGTVVDHPQYIKDMVSCVSCHEEVIMGSGLADQSRCFNCHNEPERLSQFDNTELVHRTHIAVHNVECTRCHIPMEHGIFALRSTFDLDCRACHQRTHEAQQRLYAGRGGHGTQDRPSEMFLARVSCQGCHGLPTEVKGHEEVQAAGEATCMSCHGIKYANILPAWQDAMERKVAAVAQVVRGARAAVGSVPVRMRAMADSLVGQAEENLEFVRVGRGAHNIVYADELLRTSVARITEAVSSAALPYTVPSVDLGPRLSENICLSCHLGVEQETVSFGGRTFDHERHVVLSGLECTDCHTSLDEHGGTKLAGTADCDACHHRRINPMNCGTCHPGPGGAPEEPQEHPTGDFPHAPHMEAGLACSMCHQPPAMDATQVQCETCHEMHHQPNANCMSCHRDRAKPMHALAFAHSECSQCHGEKVRGIDRWTRKVCTVCHTDKVEHNAPADCQLCHDIDPLGGDDASDHVSEATGKSLDRLASYGSPTPGGLGAANGHLDPVWIVAGGDRM